MERPTNRKSTPGRPGFTLVEMLVVIFILVIVIGLVVGVSRLVMGEQWKKQTIANEGVIEAAILAYYETKAFYPGEGTATTEVLRSKNLYTQLMDPSVPKAADKIRGLQPEAFSGTKDYFVDGKGQIIDYRSTGGRGGVPVLISPGEDALYNTADDIRSTDN